ncbi:DUF2993 domain-containing protein [Vulcanococcus sp.]|uniref:DUF2993 domain-containing protein n=1 Tax=Vulcanococcus sp. TaxID=2856995 RepID=UPI0037DA5D7D
MLNLLASGLQAWIRQQCEAVESLELQLHGSALGLLRGRLEGVSLVARRVIYSSLEIEMVELRSSAIQVQLGNLLKGQALQLHQAFQIEGYVAFTAAGLCRSLCMPQWRGLGDQLAETLLGLTPLQEVRIERDRLILQAQGMSCDTLPEAVDGHLELRRAEGEQRVALPGDPNIQISEANLEGRLLQLHGNARVWP